MTDKNPSSSTSEKYNTLHATATEFIQSQDQDIAHPSRINPDRIRAIRSSTGFQHSWGHNYMTTVNPGLSGIHDVDGFIKHLGMMTPRLESWDTDITDLIVDEMRNMVVVRGSYWMKAKGAQEAVENDLVWFLEMEEDGTKVKKSVEFIDGSAGQKLQESMKEAMDREQGGNY